MFDSLLWILDEQAPSDREGVWEIEVPEKYREADAQYFV